MVSLWSDGKYTIFGTETESMNGNISLNHRLMREVVDAQTTSESIGQVTVHYKQGETLLYIGISKGLKSFIISSPLYRTEAIFFLFFFFFSIFNNSTSSFCSRPVTLCCIPYSGDRSPYAKSGCEYEGFHSKQKLHRVFSLLQSAKW